MRVLTILHSLSIGGVEKTLYHCLPGLQSEGIEMTICCFEKGGNLEEDYKAKGVNVIYIKKTGSFLADFFQLYKIVKNHHYDIIHSRLSYTSGGFALACRFLKIPFIVSIHNEFPATLIKWSKRPFFAQFRNLYLKTHKFFTKKYATLIVGHSRSNLDRNYPHWETSEQFKVLYNGVDFDYLTKKRDAIEEDFVKSYMSKLGENSFKMIHIGTFKEQKNHLFMLDSFSKLNPILNNYHLILLGDGELRKQIEDTVTKLELHNNVHLIGFSKNVGAWIKQSDLFFFPSLFEGFANVIIEAQYLGLPICASKIKPHFESVHDYYHKYFFSPIETDECVLKLTEIISDVKKGNTSNKTFEIKQYMGQRFSIDGMAKNLVSIYHSIR